MTRRLVRQLNYWRDRALAAEARARNLHAQLVHCRRDLTNRPAQEDQ